LGIGGFGGGQKGVAPEIMGGLVVCLGVDGWERIKGGKDVIGAIGRDGCEVEAGSSEGIGGGCEVESKK